MLNKKLILEAAGIAVKAAKGEKKAKFDESFDLSIVLNTKVNVNRGVLKIPHGTGRIQKVAIIAENVPSGIDVDRVDFKDLMAEIKDGKIEYDRYFIELKNAKEREFLSLAKILGPRGLMPSVKNGCIISTEKDWDKVVDYKNSRMINIRTDRKINSDKKTGFNILNVGLGRASFDEEKLLEHIGLVIDYISENNDDKKVVKIIEKMYVSTTMGKSFKVNI